MADFNPGIEWEGREQEAEQAMTEKPSVPKRCPTCIARISRIPADLQAYYAGAEETYAQFHCGDPWHALPEQAAAEPATKPTTVSQWGFSEHIRVPPPAPSGESRQELSLKERLLSDEHSLFARDAIRKLAAAEPVTRERADAPPRKGQTIINTTVWAPRADAPPDETLRELVTEAQKMIQIRVGGTEANEWLRKAKIALR